MKRQILLACLLLIVILLTDTANAQRLFVLVAADTSDEITSDGVEQNMQWIRDTFYAKVPKDRLLVRFLEGDKVTKDALLASIAGCPLQEDDTLVFWWIGRGEFDDDQQRTLLLPDGTRLAQSVLRDLVVGTSARLSVLVIDAFARTVPATDLPEKSIVHLPADIIDPAFHALFFEPSGLLEIDSASFGQSPLLTTKTGGLLTTGLVIPPGGLGGTNDEAGFVTLNTPSGERELILEPGLLWRDLNESVRWDTLLAQLRTTTTANYRRALGRKHSSMGQTPTFEGTFLKYPKQFVEWDPVSDKFRSRPRESRTVLENDREVTYQGDTEIFHTDSSDAIVSLTNEFDDRPIESLDYYEVVPGDHLIELNGIPVRSEGDYHRAINSLTTNPSLIRFVVVDNMTGEQLYYQTSIDMENDRSFGLKPWFWKDSHVIVHEVQPDSPAGRAKVTRIIDPELPAKTGLGIRGSLVELDSPLTDGERMVGVKVESVADPERSDLTPGDILLMVDGCSFSNAEGYQYAVQNARQLAGIWYLDGDTGEVEHGHASLPHRLPEEFVEPPDDTMTISVTPTDIDSCPIW